MLRRAAMLIDSLQGGSLLDTKNGQKCGMDRAWMRPPVLASI